ncbi:hypothetical protein H5410_001861 [Solanum commersonii]|uniref:CCHC-type domain-containing protein n=1 Tax=Solanum commersonii TaxID=4109 RepID=A0A9J6B0A0_SOLCO|nr:hypothetical protein H5410_001861 [Solanum commersonii]
MAPRGRFVIVVLSGSFMMSENNDSHCRTYGLSMSLSRPNDVHEVAGNSLADAEAFEFDVESVNDARTMEFNDISLDGGRYANGEGGYRGRRRYGADGGYGGRGERYGGGGGGKRGIRCYKCGDDGHFSRKCSQGGGKYGGMVVGVEVVVVVTSVGKKGW